MGQPIPEHPQRFHDRGDVFAAAGGPRESLAQALAPQLLVVAVQEVRPEPEGQPGDDLVAGLPPEITDAPTNGLDVVINPVLGLLRGRDGTQEPGDAARVVVEVATQLDIHGVPEDDLDMADGLETGRGQTCVPQVELERFVGVFSGCFQVRTQSSGGQPPRACR